jgi:predicted signal transduction protein with EAL and GGDEF domain
LDGISIRGSASVGIAIFPEDGRGRDALFNRADAGMYTAKHHRRPVEVAPAEGESETARKA